MLLKDYYLISDIHGCVEEFNELLKLWQPEKQILVLLGDYIDRGLYSLEVIRLIMDLKSKYPEDVYVLRGNHESNFLKWLRIQDIDSFWDYLKPTFLSFYFHDEVSYAFDNTVAKKCNYILKNFEKEIKFIESLPYYIEEEHILFVHAGVNLDFDDWEDTHLEDFIKIREKFYNNSKTIGKKIFFGHTPTIKLRGKWKDNSKVKSVDLMADCSFWESQQGDKICIDGGCSFGFVLNGVVIDYKGNIKNVYQVKTK